MKMKLTLAVAAILLLAFGGGFAVLGVMDVPVAGAPVTKTIPNERFLD